MTAATIAQERPAEVAEGGDTGALPPHGTLARYNGRHRCRCSECRAASAEHARRRRRGEIPKRTPSPHGTHSRQSKGCSCRRCRAAHRRYMQRRRKGTAEVTDRRQQRIAAARWEPRPFSLAELEEILRPTSANDLARMLDTNGVSVRRWRRTGLTADQADTLAVRAGLHPAEVWPGW